jgi:hypothetical protein
MNHNFIVRENENEVLISLALLVRKLNLVNTKFWSFKNIDSMGQIPFGLDNEEFERLTKCFSSGLIINNSDFDEMLNSDFQIIDGEIEVYLSNSSEPVVKITCCDSSFWEISTRNLHIAEKFII